MEQRRRSLWELRLWVLTGLSPALLPGETLLFIDFIIRACKMWTYTGNLLACYLHLKKKKKSRYIIHQIITEEDISFCRFWIKGKQSVPICDIWDICVPHFNLNNAVTQRTWSVPTAQGKSWTAWRTKADGLLPKWTADSSKKKKKKRKTLSSKPLQQRKSNTLHALFDTVRLSRLIRRERFHKARLAINRWVRYFTGLQPGRAY